MYWNANLRNLFVLNSPEIENGNLINNHYNNISWTNLLTTSLSFGNGNGSNLSIGNIYGNNISISNISYGSLTGNSISSINIFLEMRMVVISVYQMCHLEH